MASPHHEGMKALILVGGYGTRLRPFTLSLPKPLVPFGNKAIVFHQIEALIKVGVKEIVLAVNVQPEALTRELSKFADEKKITIRYSKEDVPLGTAGPLALARELLRGTASEPSTAPFFMFNSDVICDFPLDSMLKFHQRHGGDGTILVTEVKDPTKYGVVVHKPDGQIERFVEKPQVYVGNRINAGIYLLNPSVVDMVPPPPKQTSIEREIFPKIVEKEKLFSMLLPGYWMDIGQPKDYLTGTVLYLENVHRASPHDLVADNKTGEIKGNVLQDQTAKVGAHCQIGPDVIIGANCVIGKGVRLVRTTLMEGTIVKDGAFVKDSIIGWGSTIGEWARLEGCSIGMDVQVAREIILNETIVLPHKGVPSSQLTPGTIIM